jgi:hypothetical protein
VLLSDVRGRTDDIPHKYYILEEYIERLPSSSMVSAAM